jgi:hypothetical protein
MPGASGRKEEDTSFAVVHGLYWLLVNLAARRSVLLAVDDAHWGDDASLRWLAYLAARLDGIEASLVVSLRPHEPRSQGRPLQAVRAAANATVRPSLLSEQAVAAIAQKMLGIAVEGDVCASIHRATGGNPFYVLELVRGSDRCIVPNCRECQSPVSIFARRCPHCGEPSPTGNDPDRILIYFFGGSLGAVVVMWFVLRLFSRGVLTLFGG